MYREKNKEKIQISSKVYRNAHRVIKIEPLIKEKTCHVCKTTYSADDDTYFHKKSSGKYGLSTVCRQCFKLRSDKYYQDNSEHIKEKCTQYYFKNIDKKKIYSKKWHLVYDKTEKGRNIKIIAWEKRRALELNLGNNYSNEQWIQCKSDFNSECAYCGKTEKLTIEHFIPVSKFGELTINNVIPVCSSCNSSKGNRAFEIWYPKQLFYSKTRESKILKYLHYKNNIQQLTFTI